LAKKVREEFSTVVGSLTLLISVVPCKCHQWLVYIGSCLIRRLQERCWQAGARPVEDHAGVWSLEHARQESEGHDCWT